MKSDSRRKYSQNGIGLSSKRYSLSKSKKSQLQYFLNSSFIHKDFNKNVLSTSAQFNPEIVITSPYQRLCMSKKQKKIEHNHNQNQKNNRTSTKDKRKKTNKNTKIIPNEQIQKMLKQDVKLRVLQSVQMGQWIELLRQYKLNRPKKQLQANIVLRQFQKIMQLKQSLQLRKYRLMSSII